MKVSIVICTYGRPEATKNLLSELEKQRYKDFEVVVVCQGKEEDLEKIKRLTGLSYSIRYYYEPEHNLPHARNVGIKESSGKIILFLDDDTKPHPELVEAHLANYTDPKLGIVGGRILGEIHKEDIPDSRIGTVRAIDGYKRGGFHKDIRREVMHVRGVNMSVRKRIAQDIGGFDERFEGAAEYEDMDFCLRILKKGYRIIFDPKAVVEHLALKVGGCRAPTEEKMIYWLYRNHNLAFLNNFNKFSYPILAAEYIARIIARSLIWHNHRIIGSAFRGIRDGWKAHFKKLKR